MRSRTPLRVTRSPPAWGQGQGRVTGLAPLACTIRARATRLRIQHLDIHVDDGLGQDQGYADTVSR